MTANEKLTTASPLAQFPASNSPEKRPSRKVMVAGYLDLLHASQAVFLNKGAAIGKLYVSLGSDDEFVRDDLPDFRKMCDHMDAASLA